MEYSGNVQPCLQQRLQAETSFTVRSSNVPPHTMLTDVTSKDMSDTTGASHQAFFFSDFNTVKQESTRHKKKTSKAGKGNKNKMNKLWSTFILPTDLPQKQFHNLICMGLFQLCHILMMIADRPCQSAPTSSQAFPINSPRQTPTTPL